MKTIAAISCCMVCAFSSTAQVIFDIPEAEKKKVNPNLSLSFQVALGLVDPSEVNNYIAQEVHTKLGSGPIVSFGGNTNISTAGAVNIAFDIRIKEKWRLRFPVEYGGGSKTVIVNSETTIYRINRFSLGGMGAYYIPWQNNGAFFLGAGLFGHFMSFENFSASCFGGRGEAGISWFGVKTDKEIFILLDWANGKTSGSGTISTQPSGINMSGLFFGIRFIF